MAFQHVGELLLGIIRVEVGQKAQVATVDANDFNIVTGEGTGGAQHIAVATDHHGQVGLLSNFRQRAGFNVF